MAFGVFFANRQANPTNGAQDCPCSIINPLAVNFSFEHMAVCDIDY